MITAGIATPFAPSSLQVVQRGAGANMSVDVSTGDCHIVLPSTTKSYWCWTDAATNVAVTAADATNGRIDTVVAWLDQTTTTTGSNNSPGSLKFRIFAGTPAGSPVATSDSTIQSTLGASIGWVKLATVLVGANVTTITTGNITDARVAVLGIPPVKDGSITSAKVASGLDYTKVNQLTRPYGRIYFSTYGASGGQVVTVTTTAVLSFNTLDSDSVDVTKPSDGQLKVSRAGRYSIFAHARLAGGSTTEAVLRIQASIDNGATWYTISPYIENGGTVTISEALTSSTFAHLAADTLLRAQLYSGTNQIRIASEDVNSQKYEASLVVGM
jgi:hypothetical protein